MNRDALRKAQGEVEAVVGKYRLPDFDDDLPYIKAVVMEGLRWIPVVPLGVPHSVTTDDVYRGYHIPKGSIIMPVSIPLLAPRSLWLGLANHAN